MFSERIEFHGTESELGGKSGIVGKYNLREGTNLEFAPITDGEYSLAIFTCSDRIASVDSRLRRDRRAVDLHRSGCT